MYNTGKTVTELHAMLKLHEQTLPLKEDAPDLHVIRAGRIQKNQKKKSHKAAKGNQGKGKAKMGYAPVPALSFAPKPKNPLTPKKDNPAQGTIYHQCGEGLRGGTKLEPGALNLYVGDGHRATVKAIGEFHLCLPSGLKHREKLQHDGLLDSTDIKSFEKCVSCMSGKMAEKNLIHIRYGYVYVLKHKHEVFETFKVFQKEVENHLEKTIKSLRSDRGGEYMSQEFLDHLKEHEIIAHRTPPYTPQHNGVSERRNRTLLDMVRFMMSQTTLSKSFWDYALESAA
ncbi:retrotransposon protein, putative, ty1-copia subclass [Tanacetum coccineum]